MRIAYLGAFAPSWNTEALIARALRRLGHDVLEIEEAGSTVATITRAAVDSAPALFLFAKGRVGAEWDPSCRQIAEVLRAVREATRAKVACWVFDLLAADFAADRWEWAQAVSRLVDVFAMTDGSTAARFSNALHLTQGVCDDVDQACTWEAPIVGDVLFLGSTYRDRWQFVEAFGRKFGPRFHVENNTRGPALTRLVRSYRMCVAPYYPSRGGYWSNRLYVVTGHGGLFAAPSVQGMETEGWLAGKNYLALPLEPETMAAQVEEYLRYDSRKLDAIRRAGFAHASTACTYEVRVEELLAHLAMAP